MTFRPTSRDGGRHGRRFQSRLHLHRRPHPFSPAAPLPKKIREIYFMWRQSLKARRPTGSPNSCPPKYTRNRPARRCAGLHRWIDELDAGRFPGLYLVVTGTPSFFDGPQGVQKLAPLAQRLQTDFATEARFDNPRAPQIRLRAFGQDEMTDEERNLAPATSVDGIPLVMKSHATDWSPHWLV